MNIGIAEMNEKLLSIRDSHLRIPNFIISVRSQVIISLQNDINCNVPIYGGFEALLKKCTFCETFNAVVLYFFSRLKNLNIINCKQMLDL